MFHKWLMLPIHLSGQNGAQTPTKSID